MKHRREDIMVMARQVADRIDESLRNGAPDPVIDGGRGLDRSRQDDHEHWGPLRELADVLLYRIRGRGLRDAWIDRQRD
jgi:hypothetical protein